MNEEFMEFDSYLEFYKSNNIVEQKPKPHGSRQDNFIDSPGDFESPGDLSEEQEPLFVEDRTNNFRLRYAIQYEVISYTFYLIFYYVSTVVKLN